MNMFTRIVIGTALLLPASVSAQQVENGYPVGSLAVAAIERQDWATAERLLADNKRLDRSDPARLLNLARVYLATDRTAEAVAVWQQVLASGRNEQVETGAGVFTSTDKIARHALSRYGSQVQTASR